MSDGMLSRHATLNAGNKPYLNYIHIHKTVGAIPASAEELSQRYAKLFQQYSRLKAQHAVLKKAVIKEQASNVSLQGNVKEKEKELRKLQEQLDLLAFHNERLTKRIQAVQENEQKGSHFSLLGGSIKKELEKSKQALEEAQKDLQTKIERNEELHSEKLELEEKTEQLRNQIHDLEKRVSELSDENANLQAEAKNNISVTPIVSGNHEEVEALRKQLEEQKELLKTKEEEIKNNDIHLVSEIQSLRAILLAKVGHLDKKEITLQDALPASKALEELEEQARQYISSLGANDTMQQLPAEIAERLFMSTKTFSQELSDLVQQLEDTKSELNNLLIEKDQQSFHEKEKTQEQQSEYEAKIQEQEQKINSLLATVEANERTESKTINELRSLNDQLALENAQLQQEIEQEKLSLEKTLQELEKANEKKEVVGFDKETQVDIIEAKEEEEEVFVYPKKTENTFQESSKPQQQQEEEEDEEVFVYRGMDALPKEEEKEPEIVEEATKQYDDHDIQVREEKLKAFYEIQISNLNEKVQSVDSKAVRLAALYQSAKEKLVAEESEKLSLAAEVERLTKQVKDLDDKLETTKSDYQKYMDQMAEYVASLTGGTPS
ncbi:uncharacterized protein B0P05DRAFT_635091 [Gilbertella persicaria]|uniref:uncharacterized protein n=1 Tax=Gilbertella persicaria TaxID=101096 RepID=UPI0022210628|nr:uncharacterized protein B0P05DRAFT_635091 [Gilbertella persicaria]KAI8087860.1 hypothetical protein B0P05DRAFT_635091 [Gilbertella persicaria]